MLRKVFSRNKPVQPTMIKLGDIVPNFRAESTIGEIEWHSYIG